MPYEIKALQGIKRRNGWHDVSDEYARELVYSHYLYPELFFSEMKNRPGVICRLRFVDIRFRKEKNGTKEC